MWIIPHIRTDWWIRKEPINSNDPKRRDKLITARDQNQTLKLQALFKMLFETLRFSSGNIPLSWLIFTAHSAHWWEEEASESHEQPLTFENLVESSQAEKRAMLPSLGQAKLRKERDWQWPSLRDWSTKHILFISSSFSVPPFPLDLIEFIWILKLRITGTKCNSKYRVVSPDQTAQLVRASFSYMPKLGVWFPARAHIKVKQWMHK